jgi:hypothetical protein
MLETYLASSHVFIFYLFANVNTNRAQMIGFKVNTIKKLEYKNLPKIKKRDDDIMKFD